jgi:hypothetical protein
MRFFRVSSLAPVLRVYETDKEIVVKTELPEVKKEIGSTEVGNVKLLN